MIETYTYQGKEDGPHLLILGAVHGVEVCGYHAGMKLVEEIKSGAVTLKSGTVTIIPKCNPKAFDEGIHWTEENLNRVFADDLEGDTYEHQQAREIMPHIRAADYLLDVHSYCTDGPPFIIQDADDDAAAAFACAQGFEYVMTGWRDVYQNSNSTLHLHDSCMYASEHGCVGITVEAGENGSQESITNAYYAILNSMGYLDITDMTPFQIDKPTHFVRMQHLITCPPDARFAQPWRHMDQIMAGDIIGYSGDEAVKVPYSGRILLPKSWAEEGREWYYLGIDDPSVRPLIRNRPLNEAAGKRA